MERGRVPEYRVWANAVQRCCNPKNPYFPDYGGRGITICERWRESFRAFLSDVGPRPSPKYWIDRIDNNGNYEPGNIRWATAKEQADNRRNSAYLSYMGETRRVRDWARLVGLGEETIQRRIRNGMTVELALTTPLVITGMAARKRHAA